MQLDKFTDYALRILVMLAIRAPDRVSVATIAKAYGLSEHHLSKIASALAHGGFVLSERGRGGGMTLARPASEVSVGAVVRCLKAGDPVVECFGPEQTCRILPVCGLRQPLKDAQEAFFAALDRVTLAQVCRQKRTIAALLAD
jgi:Rrf2 family transcriptional regulator, nitric oxide-sensitive transcriptional repressor